MILLGELMLNGIREAEISLIWVCLFKIGIKYEEFKNGSRYTRKGKLIYRFWRPKLVIHLIYFQYTNDTRQYTLVYSECIRCLYRSWAKPKMQMTHKLGPCVRKLCISTFILILDKNPKLMIYYFWVHNFFVCLI